MGIRLNVRRRFGISLMVSSVLLSGCALHIPGTGISLGGRSAEKLCDTYQQEKDAYVTKYAGRGEAISDAGSDSATAALLTLGMTMETIGDIAVMFEKFASVAPDDIRPDVEAIRDSFGGYIGRSGDAVKDPLGSLVSGLLASLATQGSWLRFEQYISQHCSE